ncbi:MAG: YkgJ family cysteine cluster protein [Dehalococcoidales bacterium]|nr:YkgJ family cysteine cluster protein [Dehalococcoidales bacterium]
MIPLKSNTTILKITSIDEHVLVDRYTTNCMNCSCNDICCSYGCPVDYIEVERILSFKDDIENRINIPATEWFTDETEPRTGFPSGKIMRTRVVNGRCVFLNRVSRGCHLHALALEKGIDPHSIKPLICFLFPFTWEDSCLYVSEFLDELPCHNAGDLILDAQIPELKAYLGDEFVSEVKQLQSGISKNPSLVG